MFPQRMPAAQPTSRLPAAVWPGFVAVLVLLAHAPAFFHRLLDRDEAIYGSIAALMNTGGALYDSGGVDNKPPGIYWSYALTFRVFGNYQMTAVHAIGLLAMAATCVVIFFLVRRLANARIGMLAALFYGLMTAAGNPRLLASTTEIFMMLPLTASVLFMFRRQWLWTGLLLVAAGAFRQVAAVNLALVAVAIVWLEPGDGRGRAIGLFAGGALGGLVVGALLIELTGSISGFWRWTIGSLYGYASTNWIPSLVWLRAKDSILPFVVDMAVIWVAAGMLAGRWGAL